MPKEPRHHHYVPQVILNEFSDKGRARVYEVARSLGPAFRTYITSVRGVAQERDFYRQERASGADFEQEKSFSRFESLIPGILNMIKAGRPLSRSEVNALRIMTAIQDRRGYNGRHMLTAPLREAFEMSRSMYEQHGIVDAEQDARMRELIERDIMVGDIVPTPANISLETLRQQIVEVKEILNEMNVSVITSDSRDFLTSDSPVVWFDPFDVRPAFYGWSPQSRSIEVTFPVTRRHALLFSRLSLEPYLTATDDAVMLMNARTMLGARERVYGYPGCDAAIFRDLNARVGELPLAHLARKGSNRRSIGDAAAVLANFVDFMVAHGHGDSMGYPPQPPMPTE